MVEKRLFGKMDNGEAVHLYILVNKQGIEAHITNYGGTLVALKVPDRAGKLDDVVLGYDDLEGYIAGKSFLGATVGRYSNRIAQGKFVLNDVIYTLAQNDGSNSLHGGLCGFGQRAWRAKENSNSNGESLELCYLSKDGEEGYPGNLSVVVVYTLLNGCNDLKIEYSASTDKNTVLNLTNHSYFNLAGHGNGDILHHQLTLHAHHFTPVDENLVPTGELRDVEGTPFDFLEPNAIGSRIGSDDWQLKIAKGYDHNWVLSKPGNDHASFPAAHAYDPQSGRVLELFTTEPGVQFYSGNFLDGTDCGKNGNVYGNRSGFCLETQHFPNSPNQPEFPTTELKAGQSHHSLTLLRFSSQ